MEPPEKLKILTPKIMARTAPAFAMIAPLERL